MNYVKLNWLWSTLLDNYNYNTKRFKKLLKLKNNNFGVDYAQPWLPNSQKSVICQTKSNYVLIYWAQATLPKLSIINSWPKLDFPIHY